MRQAEQEADPAFVAEAGIVEPLDDGVPVTIGQPAAEQVGENGQYPRGFGVVVLGLPEQGLGLGQVAENLVQAAPVELGVKHFGRELEGTLITGSAASVVATFMLQCPAELVVPLARSG